MDESMKGCCEPGADKAACCCPGRRHKKMLPLLAATLVLLVLAVWLGFKARNEARQYKFIGVPIQQHTITVQGEGKVSAKPDIATIDLGTVIERSSVSAAQQENTRIMNALNEKLAAFGVAKADIQTASYGISPQYDWTDGKQKLRGYQVQQSLRLKIRDLDKIGDIIGAAGDLGVNQAGGINFTVDEPEALRQQARVKALENAKSKAEDLSKVVGIKLLRVVSFDENVSEPFYNAPYAMDKAFAGASLNAAPTIEAGSAEFKVNANVTYEVE